MEKTLTELYKILQKLIGLHRSLMDVVRMERDALVHANLKDIQEALVSKQALIEGVRQTEMERLRVVTQLAVMTKRPVRELTLPEIIVVVQGQNLKFAEQLRSAYNALTVLIQRISEQNRDNQLFVEKSLFHVNEMKRNVLTESVPKSNTYTQQGQRSSPVAGARILSKEA